MFNERTFFSKKIGIIIKEKRIKDKKITLGQLADQCDIDPKTLWRIEEGHVTASSFNLLKIFYLLDIQTSEYLKILLQEETK
ncbi:MAG: helix-turn-helix domain-containing protein [Cetobacterium sp.]